MPSDAQVEAARIAFLNRLEEMPNAPSFEDELDALLCAALEAAEAAAWRPIEEAPRDGTLILVWAPGREGLPPMFSLCRYHPDTGFCIDELREPTLFRRVPHIDRVPGATSIPETQKRY